MKQETRIIEAATGFGKKHNKVCVEIGQRYRVVPLNPNKKKNRDRVCRVTGFRGDRYAQVVWEDTGKRGWTECGEFVLTVDEP